MERLMVAPVAEMMDEHLMKHLENRHAEDGLRMAFVPDPDREERHLREPSAWRTYHDAMHRLYPSKYEHTHRGLTRG